MNITPFDQNLFWIGKLYFLLPLSEEWKTNHQSSIVENEEKRIKTVPISKLNKLEIKWYTDTGNLVRILDHCFTIRIYYFQKRLDTTDFSFPIP